ncbi:MULTISPECIES: stationary-phase-induced ribosome-associated protein [Providencia]|uniref:Stationary-phase-induced ribosome-associated protein n=1 Tax=Providencia stuartii TaxID=588 RepID=A0AAI9I2R1_PROST|nr:MULTISPECIES: stationary-phase-induced ribosome-associated protein [Providencia]ELR5045459.1 stationary-phase-induced ribosome-associated protein [Providencia rettgeri]ELR5037577.1 stationary-phase-induced ribosome-associated protein [Providencia stuartii]ELR5292242.1 stationary-phase-induced ribosome-associated protein [Providencia stuartii]MCR4180015.1 stationary-phase-induced ribosome-associated protein [Providencia vermicola]URE77159.1 stationary-phase-induced ribosome-associated protei
MVSNNTARRLLGMPYKLSRSKKNMRVSIIAKENATQQLPAELQNKSVVAALNNKATEKKTYHSTTVFYPEYVIS